MKIFTPHLSRKRLLAISIGICYFWFGTLKFFPGLSPADVLAKDTIHHLTFGLIPNDISILLLAAWEVTIGICLILNLQIRKVIILTLVHMFLTFTPLLFFPELSFKQAPLSLTLIGQYIMKNLIIIMALFMLYPVDSRRSIPDPNT